MVETLQGIIGLQSGEDVNLRRMENKMDNNVAFALASLIIANLWGAARRTEIAAAWLALAAMFYFF